jgi:hypothetical protein
MIQIESVIDRAAVYDSDVTAPDYVTPPTLTTNLPGVTTFEVMDIPALSQEHDTLHVYAAGYGANAAWTGAVVEQLVDTEWIELASITYPSTMGDLAEALPTHAVGIDTTNDVLVEASDDDLETITQTEFDAGGNLALVGDELIQFRDVVQEGDDYRISYLNRGVLNTTPALHAIGSRFVKLESPTRVPIDASYLGESVTLRVYSFGTLPAVTDQTTFTFEGYSQNEWPPLYATMELVSGDWEFDWDHNERIGAPTNAVESVHFDNFKVTLTKGATTETFFTDGETMTLTDAEQVSLFGASVTSWDTAEVVGVNNYTGDGDPSTFADITSGVLLETGGGLFLESGGTLLLE